MPSMQRQLHSRNPNRRTFFWPRSWLYFKKCVVQTLQGVVHKARHARGGGGPRRCDSLWQGRGPRACGVTL